MPTKTNPPEQTLNTAFAELEKIVSQFEHDEVDLEQSLPQFKRGLELAQFLKQRLGQLENEIKTVKAEFEAAEPKAKLTSTANNTDDGDLPF